MVNLVWLFMLLVGLVVAAFTGRIEAVTNAIFQGTEEAVTVSLGLIAIMAFWLGLTKVAERAGLIKLVAIITGPFIKRLFPQIPRNHPAITAITLNMGAIFLGLKTTAIPLGIAAMKELQKINPEKKVASDAMCTLIALNTAGIVMIPATVIGLRAHTGSVHPAEIIGPTFLVTVGGMFLAIGLDKFLRKLSVRYRRW